MKKFVIVSISILSLFAFSACANTDKPDSESKEVSKEVSKKDLEKLKVNEKEMDPNEDLQGYVYFSGNFTGKGLVAIEDEEGNDIEVSKLDSDGNFNLKVNGSLKKQSLNIRAGSKKVKVTVLPLDKDFEDKKKAEAEKNRLIGEQVRQTQEENRIKKEAEDKLAAEAKAEEDRIKKEAEDKRIAEEERLKKEAEDKRIAEEQAKEAIANLPTEYKSALNKAYAYSEKMAMSKMGLYDQLTSEYGEKFSPEAAQYAIDNVKADWNANALIKARKYQDSMSMSPEAIRDQLTSEYGEKFTPEEADYAIQNLN